MCVHVYIFISTGVSSTVQHSMSGYHETIYTLTRWVQTHPLTFISMHASIIAPAFDEGETTAANLNPRVQISSFGPSFDIKCYFFKMCLAILQVRFVHEFGGWGFNLDVSINSITTMKLMSITLLSLPKPAKIRHFPVCVDFPL